MGAYLIASPLSQLVIRSADHFNFFDLPLILTPILAKPLGFIGDADGQKVLSETAAIAIEFFKKTNIKGIENTSI